MNINVCLLQPPGYVHALALLEAAEYVVYKARLAGYESVLRKNRLVPCCMNIVFGAHINPDQNSQFPPGTVVFNTEQLPEKSAWTSSSYKQLLEKHFVWDYSQTNLDSINHKNKALVNFYFDDALQRIVQSPEKKFDLIFYGSVNERREKILRGLEKKGLRIKRLFGLYGPERDALLGEARAVLNLHFYDAQIFQQIRVFYPLINKIPVISENFPLDSAPAIYAHTVFTPGDEDFEKFVVTLLSDGSRFEELSNDKTSQFEATRADHEFDLALKKTMNSEQAKIIDTEKSATFDKINLGSGKDYRHGYLNVDLRKDVLPDIIFDLSKKINFPIQCESELHGQVILEDGQVTEILANDVLEHVHDLETLMGNCLKLLKVGGKFVINVPYDLAHGAWQDPTHVRAFNENSWLYYTDWFWYLGWFNHRFDLTELFFNPSKYGQELINRKTEQHFVLSAPRAIDSMKVVLTKRETTPEEKTLARSYSNDLTLDKSRQNT